MIPLNGNVSGPSVTTTGRVSGRVRPWFSFREILDESIRYLKLGLPFVLPVVIFFFSKKLAAIIVTVEFFSYYLGMFIYEFDVWYNHYDDEEYEAEKATEEEEEAPTELVAILQRLTYFQNKYGISMTTIYFYLENEQRLPFNNNLDWMEIVSLVNQLSLYIGKRFKTGKGDEK